MALAVILDMDGLMIDTEPLSALAWQQATSDLGFRLPDDIGERMIGCGIGANKALLQDHFGPSFPVDECERLANDLYRSLLNVQDVPHRPGLVAFLGVLDARAIPRAVATSTATELARYNLARANVLHYFEVIVGGDQVSRGKPDPDIFLLAAQRLGHRPEDCVVLEDSEPGIIAATAAGMRPIMIPDRRIPSEQARRMSYAVVESLLEAAALIANLADGPLSRPLEPLT